MQEKLEKTAKPAGKARRAVRTETAESARDFAAGTFAQKLDDHFIVAGEMAEGKGEDSFYSALSKHSAIAAVFDGCGGMGSRRYSNYAGHTGAYMASRAACSALRSWYSESVGGSSGSSGAVSAEDLAEEMRSALSVCMQYRGETSRILGSMVRDFPTTAAIALVQETEEGPEDTLRVHCFWAGDSRVYFLDSLGLAQLTEDDLHGQDAMSNLHEDAALSNFVAAGRDFHLHTATMDVKGPFAVFAASDGCFGYLPAPFYFEDLVLSCLLEAETPKAFESALDQTIREYAGDDYTMAFMNFGYGDFSAFQDALSGRADYVKKTYIDPVEAAGADHSAQLLKDLWTDYRVEYERFLAGQNS